MDWGWADTGTASVLACCTGWFWQEVTHCLQRLLGLSEGLSKAAHCRAEQARWGELSRRAVLSASLISIKLSQRWCSRTTRRLIAWLIASAVILLARRARSVVLCRSLNTAGSAWPGKLEGPSSCGEWIQLDWLLNKPWTPGQMLLSRAL